MSLELRVNPHSRSTSAQSSTVAGPFNVEAMAAQYQQDRTNFLQLMQAMAEQVHAMRAELTQERTLTGALNGRVTAVCSANQALEARVASQRSENQNLQSQADECRTRVSQLIERVDTVSDQNELLQRQRQEAERSAALVRQRLERELQASRDAAERARLEAGLVKYETALAILDKDEADAQLSIGIGIGWGGTALGALFGGPVGAVLAGAAFSAAGAGMGAEDAARRNAAERDQLNGEIQTIKARLLVLPQT